MRSEQYITQTLSLALPSLSINGLDASPSLLSQIPISPQDIDPNDPNYEPYDPRLADKLRGLYATLESETTRVAELRREAPSAAARGFVERLKTEMETEQAALEYLRERTKIDGEAQVISVGLARRDEIEMAMGRGVAGLEALRGVTETVAKLERAARAVREVERL